MTDCSNFSALAHPDSARVSAHPLFHLSPFFLVPALIPQALVPNPLLVSLCISHLVLLAASTAARITCPAPGLPVLHFQLPASWLGDPTASQIQYAWHQTHLFSSSASGTTILLTPRTATSESPGNPAPLPPYHPSVHPPHPTPHLHTY